MVPSPTYKNLPVFGESATLVEPVIATYGGGFLPGQVFPAEYQNWLMNYITYNSLANQTTVQSLAAEVISVLSAASISPIPASTGQLYQALNVLYATAGGLAAETNARVAADTTLQNNINAEASTRSAADTTLQNNINTKQPISASFIGVSGNINIPAIATGIPITFLFIFNTSFVLRYPVATGEYTAIITSGNTSSYTTRLDQSYSNGVVPVNTPSYPNICWVSITKIS